MPTNTAPAQPSVREYREQVSHTIRRSVDFSNGTFVMPAGVPAGSLITSTQILVTTAFSAGAALTIGSAAGGNDIVAAGDSSVTAAGVKRPDTATLKGPLAADTNLYGTISGAPAAGQAIVVFHYVPNNDA